MSSPPGAQNDPSRESNEDADLDAEMADAQDTTTQGGNVASSDNDLSNAAMAADPTQPSTQTQSALPPQSRKDVTLREFLSKMDDYAPIIPDAVTAHYLTLAGLPPPSASDPSGERGLSTPLPLARLLALATQKFVADVAADAYQYSRIRASNTAAGSNPLGVQGLPGQAVPGQMGPGVVGGGSKGAQAAQLGVQRAGYGGGGQGGSAQGKTVLTMEDLGMAVQEYGINVKRGEFYR